MNIFFYYTDIVETFIYVVYRIVYIMVKYKSKIAKMGDRFIVNVPQKIKEHFKKGDRVTFEKEDKNEQSRQ